MKALDTNILARYLRDDDPDQSRRAGRLIQRAVKQREALYLNHVVLCELVWILESVYDHHKDEIIETVEAILFSEHFRLEDRAPVESALEDYKKSKADFADCLIGRRNRASGCEVTLSFDRRLKYLEAFEVL